MIREKRTYKGHDSFDVARGIGFKLPVRIPDADKQADRRIKDGL